MAVVLLLAAPAPFFAFPAQGQDLGSGCAIGPDEAAVHNAILQYFRVYASRVHVIQNANAVSAKDYTSATAQAVKDFNLRNAQTCEDTDISDQEAFHDLSRTRLSRVGFDSTQTLAFGEITMIGDPEIGASHYVHLRKSSTGWAVVHDEQYRIF